MNEPWGTPIRWLSPAEIDAMLGDKPQPTLSANRWDAFSDEEIRVIYVEMVTDDCIRYGYSEGDEPAYTIWRELIREIERRGINESV